MRLVELIRRSDAARALPGASADLEVERSVCDRLYGNRAAVTVTPIPHGAAPLGRLVGGRYRLVERLGAGGMATVYRARDEQLGREVAVKVIGERHALDPLFVRRFRWEAQLGARLAHPNIVAVLDAGTQPRDFIVTELVRGLDAATLLGRRARLTPGEIVDIVVQVCDALAHAHARGVIHLDVSPGNVLIAEADGTAKLADFGLASEAIESPVGRVRRVMGTPGYVAPEITCGAKPTPRSDLYSLGAVAYRLLLGPEVPSVDPGCTAPLPTAVPRRPPLSEGLPGLPRGMYEAVQQALAPEPDARQESVAEFRAQLLGGHTPSRGLWRGGVLPFPDAVQSQVRTAA
jgi:eukaryotic-like serine/threonine-protein kinase